MFKNAVVILISLVGDIMVFMNSKGLVLYDDKEIEMHKVSSDSKDEETKELNGTTQ